MTIDNITVSKPKTNMNFTSQESMIQSNDLIKDFIRKFSVVKTYLVKTRGLWNNIHVVPFIVNRLAGQIILKLFGANFYARQTI